MNINFENLKASHGDKAASIWEKICEIGGFGRIQPDHAGGLDVSGLPATAQAEIQALLAPAKKEK